MNKAILIINIYIENSCMDEKIKIGQFRGDGLLISTPMGSLCKSLSLNGPLMDRNMQLILITPICPLTMKFRPLCLPATTNIFLDIDESCRTEEADIYIDENSKYAKLKKGELLSIKLSKFTTRLVSTLI
jgi:NAD+ kinase